MRSSAGFRCRVLPLEGGRIRAALGAAIETRAAVMVEDGARAEAVRFVRLELDANRASSIEGQLQATLDRVNAGRYRETPVLRVYIPKANGR